MNDCDKTRNQLVGELEAQLRQQHALLDSTSDAIITTDLDSVIQSWNRAAEALYGWSAEEAIGQQMGKLVPTEYENQNGDDARAKLQAEGAWSGEVIQTRKDGRQIVVQVSADLVKDDAGRPTHVVAIHRDITGRRQAEEASLRGEQNMRAILDASPDMTLLADINGIILSANETFARRLGLEIDDVFGKSVFDYAPSELIPGRKAAIEKVFRTGEPLEFEDEGFSCVFESHLSPVLGPAGQVTAVALYTHDVTERKQAEEALEERRALNDAVLECIADGIVACDQEGKLTYFNRAMREFHGLPAERIPPEEWPNRYDLYEADGKTPLTRERIPLFRAWKGEEVSDQELVIAAKGLPARTLISTGRKLADPNGNPIGAVVSVRDITERKRAEADLQMERDRFTTILESMPDGMCIVNKNHDIEFANSALKEDLGSTEGEKCHEYFHDSNEPCTFCKNETVFAGETVRWEWTSPKSGKTYDLIDTPLKNADGSISKLEIFRDITERKEMEEKLAGAAAEWQATFDATNDAVFVLDQDHRVLRSNKKAEGVFQRPSSEMIGEHCCEIVHGTADPIPECPFVRARDSLLRETAELRNDNSWLQVTVDPIVDASGRFVGAVHAVTDITERKRALDALREMNDVVEESPAAVFLWRNEEGRPVDYVSENVSKLVGHKAEDFRTGRVSYSDIIHPDDLERVETEVAAFSAGGKQTHFAHEPYRLISKDGSTKWVDDRTVLRQDAAGRITHYQCIVLDITDHKQAEESLRLKNLVFDAAIAANSIADVEGIITEANQAFLDIWGYSGADEVIGKPISHFLFHQEEAAEIVATLSETGRWAGDYLARKEDGSTFLAQSVATVLRDASAEIVGYQSSVIDVTEKRNLQANLAQSDRLASMGMLAAGVAHEINNPLSYVLYNLESLTEDLPRLFGQIRATEAIRDAVDADGTTAAPDDGAESISPGMLEDLVERAKEAADGARRIRDITLGLGAFSRVEQDGLTRVSPHDAIEHAISMCFNEIKYRAQLVKDFGRGPTVLASEGRLAQVALNLLTNASHAIDEGDVEHNEIRIRTWSEGEDAFFEVRDTGRGIPPEDLERLFEPFFTTKPVGVGSGLGLPICESIVSSYGGDIAVKSKVGEGTCVTVRLPSRREETERVETRGAAEPAADPAERGRVMVIDDEEPIRSLMKRLLGTHHEVVTAESGAAAMELLERDRSFDLIICDVMMPAVSGMDLHKWLVDTDPDLAKNLLFITGGAFTPKTREYLAQVENLRVEKPFNAKNLQRLVRSLITTARSKTRQST